MASEKSVPCGRSKTVPASASAGHGNLGDCLNLVLRYIMLKLPDRITAVKHGRINVECGSTTNAIGCRKGTLRSASPRSSSARAFSR
ncbi:MAG: hypothetical protein IT523_10610 [Burkholderiales bacterium]|nr:hypothetical protein [Burkholderiales bacterium]